MAGTDRQPMNEVKSPTALVFDYLQSKGMQPTSENVRRALEANARNPGAIAGLVNEAPDPADAQPTTAPSVANKIEAKPAVAADAPPDREQTTSAAPTPTGPTPTTMPLAGPGLGSAIVAGLGLPALLGAAYKGGGLGPNTDGPGAGLFNAAPQTPGLTPADVNATRSMYDPIHGSGQVDYSQLVPPAPPTDPLQAALEKATGGPDAMAAMTSKMAVGPTQPTGDAVDAAIASGARPAPEMPFRPTVGPRVPPAAPVRAPVRARPLFTR